MFRRGTLVLAILLVAALVPATVRAGSGVDLSMFISLGSNCIGFAAPPRETARLTLRTRDATLVERVRVPTNWGFACFRVPISGGYRIHLSAAGQEIEVWVPYGRLVLDRDTDTLSGRARRNLPIHIEVWLKDIFGNTVDAASADVPVGDDRLFSWDLEDGKDIVAFSGAYATQEIPNAIVGWDGMAPGFRLRYLSARVSGYTGRVRPDSLSLLDADDHEKAVAGAGAYFSMRFDDEDGRPVPIRGGDTVIASYLPDDPLRVPFMVADADVSSDQVTVRCMPDTAFTLLVGRAATSGHTDPSGDYLGPLGADVHAGVNVQLTCATADGDRIKATGRTVP